MPKKPPDWRQTSLFPPDSGDLPESQNDVLYPTEGDQHAVQDNRSSPLGAAPGHVRPAPKEPEPASDDGSLRRGTKGEPRSLEGKPVAVQAGQRSESDQQRSLGAGTQGTGGSFALRITAGRQRTATARRSNGVSHRSHVERLKQSRGERSLFDALEDTPYPSAVSATYPSAVSADDSDSSSQKSQTPHPNGRIASGEKGKARDIVAAIRTLKAVEQEQRPATEDEKKTLARFAGFGPVALSIFPDPVTGKYKDAGWEALGEELKTLLSPQEYDSAKRTTFNAFYTSPTVISAIHDAIERMGVPQGATILEPGCGIGNFMSFGPPGQRFIGVEMDSISGRIARALHPGQDIRIENFRDTRLP